MKIRKTIKVPTGEITERTGRIYIIRNNVNNKVYVGQTILRVEQRLKQHLSLNCAGVRNKFPKAIKEIGANAFYIEILEDDIPLCDLNERECYWINHYDSYRHGYNSNQGGCSHSPVRGGRPRSIQYEGETAQLTVRIKQELHFELRKKAAIEGKTMAQIICELLTEYLNAPQRT